MTSPARHSPRKCQHSSLCGGNLARVLRNAPSLRRGSFSFIEQPQQFGAQITDAGWGRSLPSTSAGAMREAAFSGKSRPFPSVLPKVDHFTHRGAPIFVDETKFNRSAFA